MVRVFGYGSLMSFDSARLTIPTLSGFRPAILPGHRRVFDLVSLSGLRTGKSNLITKEMAAVGVVPCSDGGMVFGVCFELPDSEMMPYIEREHRYRLIDVTIEVAGSGELLPAKTVVTFDSNEEYRLARISGDEEWHERVAQFYTEGELFRRNDVFPCREYLQQCLDAAFTVGRSDWIENFLENSFLGDSKTSIRDYVSKHPERGFRIPIDQKAKWDNYYLASEKTGKPPPWESSCHFAPLPSILETENFLVRGSQVLTAVEFGCGASASAIWLAKNGFTVSAIDICPAAIERAKIFDTQNNVMWIVADVLNLPAKITDGPKYDLVFDMQCFHILREVDTVKAVAAISRCLKPVTGRAVVVVGAPHETEKVGPVRLSREELLADFKSSDLHLVSLTLSQFNDTPYYSEHFDSPPPCWIAVFSKS